MVGVLDGVKVVEIGAWVAGPSAGALLADWGAELWKVESPKGDPMRTIVASQGYDADIPNAPFTVDNRGKRSVVLDLRETDSRAALEFMLGEADVLLTNTRIKSLGRMELAPDQVMARHPHLVYGLITGYGSVGPERDRAGYDVGAFGGRTGVLHQMRAGSAPPVAMPLGFGDHVVGLSAVAAVLGALIERGRTGTGQVVETSLLRTGTYALGWELGVQLLLGRVPGSVDRTASKTPLFNCYRSGDDQWFWLMGVEADRHFVSVLEATDRKELASDERFATARDRRHNRVAFIQELDATFAERPLEEWARRFDECRVWWAPVQTPQQVVEDEQVATAGCFVDVTGEEFKTVSGPVDFARHPRTSVAAAPELGAHTVDVLRSVGCDEALIERVTGRSA
jgi:crotonobetainyl-CoA:carnitine CoA-transferase CaiB-like acyl-CoA transferase